jgi:hypothetical protein
MAKLAMHPETERARKEYRGLLTTLHCRFRMSYEDERIAPLPTARIFVPGKQSRWTRDPRWLPCRQVFRSAQ